MNWGSDFDDWPAPSGTDLEADVEVTTVDVVRTYVEDVLNVLWNVLWDVVYWAVYWVALVYYTVRQAVVFALDDAANDIP